MRPPPSCLGGARAHARAHARTHARAHAIARSPYGSPYAHTSSSRRAPSSSSTRTRTRTHTHTRTQCTRYRLGPFPPIYTAFFALYQPVARRPVQATDEQCNRAQVAAVVSALNFVKNQQPDYTRLALWGAHALAWAYVAFA